MNSPSSNKPGYADLVLEGGGVKGIGLVGAVSRLLEQGYEFRRVGGTSAGAIVASLIAAGMPADRLYRLMYETPYASFRDKGFLDRLGPVGIGALSISNFSGHLV